MPMFMAHMTHPAGACYLFNEENKKKLKELSSKKEEIYLALRAGLVLQTSAEMVLQFLGHLHVLLLEAVPHVPGIVVLLLRDVLVVVPESIGDVVQGR